MSEIDEIKAHIKCLERDLAFNKSLLTEIEKGIKYPEIKHIDKIEMSTVTRLENLGFKTLGDLCNVTRKEFVHLKGMTPKTIRVVEQVMDDYEVNFKPYGN